MGILERIEEKLDKLIKGTVVGTLEETDDIVEGDIRDIDGENDERDNGGKGVVWDARIHTSNKGRTQKDIWKRKPGLEDEFFALVIAELEGKVKSLNISKKAPPSKKPPSKKPPSKKPPSKSNNFKQTALKTINAICKQHEVNFDMVISNILDKHGTDTFDGLPDELHETVCNDTLLWLEKLNKVQGEIDALSKMSKGTEHSEDISDAVKVYINEAGAEDSLLGSVPLDNLDELVNELISYSDQWNEFFSE